MIDMTYFPKRKNHRIVSVNLNIYLKLDNLTLDEVFQLLNQIREENSLIDCRLTSSWDEWYLTGYVAMTESEIIKQKKKREAASKAAETKRKRIAEKEMALLKKLSKKYPNTIEE